MHGGYSLVYEGKTVDLTPPWPHLPMKDVIITASQKGDLPPGLERAAAFYATFIDDLTRAPKDKLKGPPAPQAAPPPR